MKSSGTTLCQLDKSTSPNKADSLPRIGSRSHQNHHQNLHHSKSTSAKPLETPFIANHQILSSPCLKDSHHPVIRGPVHPVSSDNAHISSDGMDGNESFDSFDGIFQDGGPEIEELLRTVDGSQ